MAITKRFNVGDAVIVVRDDVADSGNVMGMMGTVLAVEPTGAAHDVFGRRYTVNFGEDHPSWYIFDSALALMTPEPVKPKVPFSSVVIAPQKAEQIMAAISQEKNFATIFEEWGFSEVFEKGTAVTLLFYGIPGTGKTLMAQAIADELNYPIQIISTADLETSEPGGFERKVRKIFEEGKKAAKEKKGSIILFDECDSLLVNRNRVGAIMGAQINSLLTEIEHYEGVVIFTTNRLGELDPALERRITAKIEFEFPTKEQRLAIWRRLIPSKAPLSKDVNLKKLADYPIPGGNIKNAVLNAARSAAYKGAKQITMDMFVQAVEAEVRSSMEFAVALDEVSRAKAEVGFYKDKVKKKGSDKVE